MSKQEIIPVFTFSLNDPIIYPSPKMRLYPFRKPIVWVIEVTSSNHYFRIKEDYISWVKESKLNTDIIREI